MTNPGVPRIDPYLLERVEVITGPASILYGVASPGGILNLVSKRPTESPFGEVSVQTGSFDRIQGTFDVGGPVDKDKTLLYRVTGIGLSANTQVDNMRDLLENALYAPTAGRYKVYIIDEVHMLSRNAFNAMLKTLEEPPAHVKFILATTDPQKVPVTQIRDRLQQVLDAERIQYEPPALALLARAAQGSLRDGLSLLDQAIAHGAGSVS